MILTQVGEAVDVASSVINSKDSGFMLSLLVLAGLAYALHKIGGFMFREYSADKKGAWKDLALILAMVKDILEAIEKGLKTLKDIQKDITEIKTKLDNEK